MYDDLLFEPSPQVSAAEPPSPLLFSNQDVSAGTLPVEHGLGFGYDDVTGDWIGFESQAKTQSSEGPQSNGPPTQVGDVVVYGNARRLVGWSASASPMDNGGWDGNDSDQYVFQPDWGCTGTPDGTAPDDHTMVRVRAVAEQAAERLKGSDLNNNWEWGVLIYMSPDGWLHTTDPFSVRDPGQIGFPYADSGYLPDGATIVGWVHSHPYVPGSPSQSGLSDVDDDAYTTMSNQAASNGNRFSVSSTLMTYVLDRQNNRLLEFDVDDDEGDSGVRVRPCSS